MQVITFSIQIKIYYIITLSIKATPEIIGLPIIIDFEVSFIQIYNKKQHCDQSTLH